ncbi:MAG: DUF5060 domain-containing protein [Candidatus Omnitrophota bacterium]
MMIKIVLFLLIGSAMNAAQGKEKNLPRVAQWGRFETAFISDQYYYDWVRDIRLHVEFTSPQGKKQTALALWDGGTTWRVRFSPDCIGTWRYRTICNKKDNAGLHDRTGKFVCVPYRGDNPLYRHGELRLSGNRRFLRHADGTPFLFLGDTAPISPLLASKQEWSRYLAECSRAGCNAVLFIPTHSDAIPKDARGHPAFTGEILIQIRADFFQRLDRYFDAVNEKGMIAAPILLWAETGDKNPGYYLPEDQQIVLAEYIFSRCNAHQAVWLLSGGQSAIENADVLQRIGSAVFGDASRRLASLIPEPGERIEDLYANESWFTFNLFPRREDFSLRQYWMIRPARGAAE